MYDKCLSTSAYNMGPHEERVCAFGHGNGLIDYSRPFLNRIGFAGQCSLMNKEIF